MKYLLLILVLFATSCNQGPQKPQKIAKSYPGQQDRWEGCHHAWNMLTDVDGENHVSDEAVLECEKKIENPPFKLGERVKFNSAQFEPICYGIVKDIDVSHTRRDLHLYYSVEVICPDVTWRCDDNAGCYEFTEKELKKFGKRK